jgi:hypothetical protein
VQAGALVALVSGMLVVASSPAQAIPPDVEIGTVSSTNVTSGARVTVSFKITNRNPRGVIRVQVIGMDCVEGCTPRATLDTGASADFDATLTAPQVDPGDEETVRLQVTAEPANNPNDRGSAEEEIKVRGPDKPQTVRQISGRVRDADGKAISGAQVILQDSADHKYETTSNNSGAYSFTSSDSKPIAPGQVSIGAGKEGFKPAAISVNAAAGKSVNAPSLNLASTTATPSPTPSTTDGASAPPVDDATDDATDQGETAAATDPAAGDDGGNGSMLFIILGGLLVAAGVGAIVLVLMRRKGNDEGDDADLPGGAIPPSPGGGRYGDATRVAAPVGARANDATMVANMAVPSSIADAPTMLQRPVPADDEFADPYGAPAQMAHGGYTAAPAGPYGADAQAAPVPGGYDDEYAGPATQYGRPVQQQEEYGGYVPPAADQRYDEQTGMYRPEPAYEQPAGYDSGDYQGGAGYGQQPQPGGYGQPQPEPAYGWDAPAEGGNAYGPAAGAGTYGGGRAQASGGGAYGAGRAPASGGGAYGAPAGGGTYGGAPAGGGTYGAGAPAGGGTYGAAPGGYEAPAPRGGSYGGAPNYGGDQGGANYGADQGGYDPRATYGRPDGYEQPPSRGGQQGGGYGAQGEYDQAGYGQGGYDQAGYDQQGGGRHGGPARPEPTPPGQRRPVDWLDD